MYYEDFKQKKNVSLPYINEVYDKQPTEENDGDEKNASQNTGAWSNSIIGNYGGDGQNGFWSRRWWNNNTTNENDEENRKLGESYEDRQYYHNTLRDINNMKFGNAQFRNNLSVFNDANKNRGLDISYRFTGGRWSPQFEEAHRLYDEATSPKKVQKRVNDYYDNYIKKIFDDERGNAEKRAKNQYMKHASIVGYNPHTAMGAADAEVAPEKVIGLTLSKIDKRAMAEHFAPYAEVLGISGEKYVDEVVMPMLNNKLYEEYIDINTPKSSAEYILRKANSNSLIGALGYMSRNAYSGTNTYSAIDAEAIGRYNGSRMENFVSGVGSLLIDFPIFATVGFGSSAISGRVTPMLTNSLVAGFVRKGVGGAVSKEAAKQYVKKYMKDNIVSQIVNSSITQGLTLGTYNVAQSVTNDIIYNESVNWDNAGHSFAHGLGTGALLGAAGTPLRNVASNVTGAGRLAAQTGVLSAEAFAFTMGTEFEKIENEVEVAPIDLFYDYMESVATLGVMKAAHWHPKGADRKLDGQGRLRGELRFSMGEENELRAAGVDPADFSQRVENVLALSDKGKIAPDANSVVEDYVKLMADGNISASARSKLMYIVEDKLTSSAPKPVSYNMENKSDGTVSISTYDIDGHLVKNFNFKDKFSAENYMIKNKSVMRKNKFDAYVNILTQNVNSQNFLRQANEYSKEKGVSPDDIAEAMYKRANKENITEAEAEMLNEILQRSAYTPDELNILLGNARREIEKKYNLKDRTIEKGLDFDYFRLSENENKAIEEYIGVVEGLVKGAEEGLPLEREFKEVEPSVVKRKNSMDYYNSMINGDYPVPNTEKGQSNARKYIMGYNNVVHTEEQISAMKEQGVEFSKNFRAEVEFVVNPKQIKSTDKQYYSKRASLGWYDDVNDHVVINLTNIRDAGEMKQIIIHEVVGHKSLHAIFGLHMTDFLEEIYEKADPQIRANIEKIRRQNVYRDPYVAVDEYMANLSEKVDITPKERSLLQRFKDFVKEMLVRFNLYGEKKTFSEQDLANIMQRHYEAVLRNASKGSHRRSVFGDFRNAQYGEKQYYDSKAHVKFFKEKNNDLNFENVNEYFRDAKKRTLGDLEFRFMGERGLENLKYSGNNDYNDLTVAQMLEENGVDPFFVKLKTGWERGMDGKWRYEIPEDRMYLKDPIKALSEEYGLDVPGGSTGSLREDLAIYEGGRKTSSERGMLRLRHIVDDDIFFGAYPEFADMEVRIYNGEKGMCHYDARQEVLYIDDSQMNNRNFKRELAGSMQRMIQDYEDFARAFDMRIPVEYGTSQYKKAIERINEIREYKPHSTMKREVEYLENKFLEDYEIPYDVFEKVFPSENEYNLFLETGDTRTLSGWSEVNNVKDRFDYNDYERRTSSARFTEKYDVDEQVPAVKFEEIEYMADGPIDWLMRIVRSNDSDKVLYPDKRLFMRYVRPGVTPDQQDKYKRYMNEWLYEENREKLREHRKRLGKNMKPDDYYDKN